MNRRYFFRSRSNSDASEPCGLGRGLPPCGGGRGLGRGGGRGLGRNTSECPVGGPGYGRGGGRGQGRNRVD